MVVLPTELVVAQFAQVHFAARRAVEDRAGIGDAFDGQDGADKTVSLGQQIAERR